MNEWRDCSLGELINVKHGYAFTGEFITPEPTPNILVTPGNFHIGGSFKQDKFKYFRGNYPESYLLKEGDIVVTMTDLSQETDTLGFSAKIPYKKGVKFLHNQRIGLIEFISEGADKDFIYWLLRTNEYQGFIVGASSGTSIRHTSPRFIKEYKFKLPSTEEQKAIASVLSSLDDKIDLLHRQNTTLERMAETLFRQWFIEEGQEDWEECTLDDLISVKGGTTPSTKEPQFWDGKIYWTSPRDLSNHQSVFMFNTERKITEKGLAQIGSGLLPVGTVLMSSRAPIGYLAITDISVAINQGYIAIVCDKDVSNYFMYLWCKVNMGQIKNAGNGSTFEEISKSNFKTLSAQKPSDEAILKFDNSATPLFAKIKTNQQQIQTLEKLRDNLLPKLMSGEVTIRNEVK